MRAVCARKVVYRVQLSEFLHRQLHRGAAHQRALGRAFHLVRPDHRDAADIFPEVRLRDAMAYRDAVRQDALALVRLPDDSFEARRDAVAHQTVVRQDELEIFDLAEEERLRAALCRFLILKLPMEPLWQAAALQERPAARAQEYELERQDAAPMVPPRVSLALRVAPLRELLQVSPQQVREWAAAHWLLELQS